MRIPALSFGCGVLFAIGLGLAGMTRPEKVLGFLDVAGAWDPSLALVMGGAIGVHAPLYRWVTRRPSPLWAPRFALPTRTAIDGRLLAGSAIFGIGWGLAGVCPGPGLVSLAGLAPTGALFVAAMLGGMLLHRLAATPSEPRVAPSGVDAARAEGPEACG